MIGKFSTHSLAASAHVAWKVASGHDRDRPGMLGFRCGSALGFISVSASKCADAKSWCAIFNELAHRRDLSSVGTNWGWSDPPPHHQYAAPITEVDPGISGVSGFPARPPPPLQDLRHQL